jgi:hypothetical protein
MEGEDDFKQLSSKAKSFIAIKLIVDPPLDARVACGAKQSTVGCGTQTLRVTGTEALDWK